MSSPRLPPPDSMKQRTYSHLRINIMESERNPQRSKFEHPSNSVGVNNEGAKPSGRNEARLRSRGPVKDDFIGNGRQLRNAIHCQDQIESRSLRFFRLSFAWRYHDIALLKIGSLSSTISQPSRPPARPEKGARTIL